MNFIVCNHGAFVVTKGFCVLFDVVQVTFHACVLFPPLVQLSVCG